MLGLIAVIIIAGSPFAAGAQSHKPPPGYVVLQGRCGPVYRFENEPAYFYSPKTTAQIQDVIRYLRSIPPHADVQCRDFNDAWAPYLFANRKVRIARLLIELKQFTEAREELWSLFLREGVLYQGRELHYDIGTEKAISLLLSDVLWSAKDIETRLNDPRYFVERIKAAYERRKRSASARPDQLLKSADANPRTENETWRRR